ncbi:hypothetical protein [Hyphomonas sp.]|uniref:hypothetical protein n=1 Tax=Hyphomonas sp. TaxID=87 RepID=UPI00391A8C75
MSVVWAEAVWLGLGGYLGFGLALGLLTILFGMRRLVPGVEVPVRVRLLVLPGMAAVWPVILLRLAGVRPKEDRAPEIKT